MRMAPAIAVVPAGRAAALPEKLAAVAKSSRHLIKPPRQPYCAFLRWGSKSELQSAYPLAFRCRPSLENSSGRGLPSSPSIGLTTSRKTSRPSFWQYSLTCSVGLLLGVDQLPACGTRFDCHEDNPCLWQILVDDLHQVLKIGTNLFGGFAGCDIIVSGVEHDQARHMLEDELAEQSGPRRRSASHQIRD